MWCYSLQMDIIFSHNYKLKFTLTQLLELQSAQNFIFINNQMKSTFYCMNINDWMLNVFQEIFSRRFLVNWTRFGTDVWHCWRLTVFWTHWENHNFHITQPMYVSTYNNTTNCTISYASPLRWAQTQRTERKVKRTSEWNTRERRKRNGGSLLYVWKV